LEATLTYFEALSSHSSGGNTKCHDRTYRSHRDSNHFSS